MNTTHSQERIILTDCDGCLCNWEYAFSVWMQERGHVAKPSRKHSYQLCDHYVDLTPEQAMDLVHQFNESAAIGFLPALRDSVHYVKRLHEELGYVFHCITSLSSDQNAQKLREMNLQKLFGSTVFDKIVFLPTAADKDAALEPYRNSGYFWIEDLPKNAETGLRMGLRSVLVEHGHNMHHVNKHIPIVKNWKEIFELVSGQISL